MSYALIFPGQGSQSVGMGREIYEAFPSAKNVFDEADDALSEHLTNLIFEGDEAELTLTRNAQPAIMTVSIAALHVLTEEMGAKISPFCMAGHSLGEYTALCASGAMNFAEAVRLVRNRGTFMQEAVPEGKGGMAALIGAGHDDAKKLCESVAPNGEVSPANFNCPGQVVISGLTEFVDAAIANAKSFGIKRALKLSVSAPFHSRYMKPAAEKLKSEFAKITWNDANYDIIANVDAKPVKSASEIQARLYAQTFSPVLWEDSVAYMADSGVDSFYEIGPGEVLSGLVKKCRKGMNLLSASTPEKLEALREKLGG
ncbi:MAG: ACP S-malonyltransferase [Synergistaceae bacterium]|nr:ACP S-malonyltransferase [Synergistaceae bacterium]MBQ6664462.1 ACP S-malonyltransferase [Synergistaceae bacterium]MBR0248592.1 ACP S-malonyltransferase [Synergistaceae bacterium]